MYSEYLRDLKPGYNMKYMDKLPTVISCCFCCFLRAGTVMIGILSFLAGLIFAPNVSNTKGFWDMEAFLSYYSSITECVIQSILGVVSIMLCIVSVMLIIGSFCNMPILIEVYQWGAVIYTIFVTIMFLILALMCFFVHVDCTLAGGILCVLVVCNILITTYFVIVANSLLNAYFVVVANSLRMSLLYLRATEELSMIS